MGRPCSLTQVPKFVAPVRALTGIGHSNPTLASKWQNLSAAQQRILKSAHNICQGPVLERAWRSVEPCIAKGELTKALSALVSTASADNDVLRVRRLCLRLFALGEADSTRPPLSAWRVLIGAHARAGDVHGAFALLGRIEDAAAVDPELALPPEVFEALIGGLVDGNRVHAAFHTFQRMRTWALADPSAKLYVTMIRACGLSGNTDRATELFNELAEREEPSPEAHAALIVALAGQQQTRRRALSLFNEAMQREDPLTPQLCGAIADACARIGNVDEARLLQRRMLAARVQPDARLRANLIRTFGLAASRGSDAERRRCLAHAWRVVEEARKDRSLPTLLIKEMVGTYCAARLPAHAETLLSMGCELGCKPDADCYMRVLRAFESDAARFRSLWQNMLSSTNNVQPTAAMLENALKVATASGDAHWSQVLLGQMFAAKVPPSLEAIDAVRGLPVGRWTPELRKQLRAFENASFA